MRSENIPIQNIVQHNNWSGKNCPTFLRDGKKGINWGDFIQAVREEAVKKPSNPPTKEAARMFNPTSPTLRNSVINRIEKATKDGILKDGKWLKQAKDGTLTPDDALGLFFHIQDNK